MLIELDARPACASADPSPGRSRRGTAESAQGVDHRRGLERLMQALVCLDQRGEIVALPARRAHGAGITVAG